MEVTNREQMSMATVPADSDLKQYENKPLHLLCLFATFDRRKLMFMIEIICFL